MDPELKQMLQKTLALSEENNLILHKIRGVQKREFIWRTLKIIVIIGITLGSFYYLEPYLNKIMDLYSSISGVEQKVNGASNDSLFQGLLKKF
ncbi:MAG: hypothetical protein WC839_00090 [Candidatus Paceibacterota bacterium]